MRIALPEDFLSSRKRKPECTSLLFVDENENDMAKRIASERNVSVEERTNDELAYLARLEDEACELAESGEFRAAVEKFQRLCASNGATSRHFEMKAQLHMELGEYWEAIKASTKSVELDGEWADVFLF